MFGRLNAKGCIEFEANLKTRLAQDLRAYLKIYEVQRMSKIIIQFDTESERNFPTLLLSIRFISVL